MKHHLLTLLLLLIPVSLVAGRCQENQQSLLLQLKHGLNFSRSFSQKLVEWNASTECCEWPGIRCDSGVLGRVIGLNLSYESITGTTVPAALANLTNLRYLNLSAGSFFGQVPASFSRMTSLVGLDLSKTSFNGVLPPSIGNLENLSWIDISKSNFIGTIPKTLNQSRLAWLDLSDNNINGVVPRWIPESTSLSLSNNSLTGPIPTSICNFANLEVLDLSDNHLNDIIPDCLIENTKTLLVLDLSGNKLSGDIPNIFQAPCSLETLDLNNNQFQGRVPKSLESCKALQVLDLGNNKISDVFPCLGRINSSLRVLILRNNLFHGSIWCPHDLHSTWQNLQIVDLAFNNFHGPLNAQFLTTWEAMMRADGNEMNNHLRHGPVFIRDSYYEDSITLSNKGHQTEYVKILEVFKSIDFSSNNFDGTIPQVMGKFTALQILNLSHNAFTSQIPSVLGNLSNLESLDLSNNRLTGRIPKELADMSFLAVLNLSDNNLNGSIPIGSQFQTFDNTSFGGNPNLCGQPLFKSCFAPPAPPKIIVGESTTSINWDLLSKAFGFIFGLGVVMLPAALWPSFRVWYWPKIDYLLIWMFPKIYLKDRNNRLRTRRRQQRRSKQTMTSSQQNHSPAISCT
ncbi:Receptor-like protein 43 [Linum perenne]